MVAWRKSYLQGIMVVVLGELARHHGGGARGAWGIIVVVLEVPARHYGTAREGGGDVIEVHGVMLMKFDGCSLVA